MQQIGYSLLNSNNTEVLYWGDSVNQCAGIPDMIILPNGDHVHVPVVGTSYGGYTFVQRWSNCDLTKQQYVIKQSSTFDGTKVVIEYTYRNPTSEELIAYSANTRYNIETSGITFQNNFIATDRSSQAMLTGIVTLVTLQPNTVINFKTANGFIQANSSTMINIANAVAIHVQTCFNVEYQVAANIASGSITNTSQITAAYNSNAIISVF